jgi:flagellar export protein FliJ
MAQFLFKLAPVLRHRKNVEQEHQRDVAVIEARLNELEWQLRALDADVQRTNEHMRQNHLVGRIAPDLLAAHRRYLTATQRRALEIAQQMATVQRSLDEARLALATAARDHKILEKLQDRQRAAWQSELDRRERNALDEVATQMAHRARK